jgi:hypothetical protein
MGWSLNQLHTWVVFVADIAGLFIMVVLCLMCFVSERRVDAIWQENFDLLYKAS